MSYAIINSAVRLVITPGSVVTSTCDAIVNAANTGCLGGGAVDGAISHAGGPLLLEAQKAIPIVPNPHNSRTKSCRCPTGEARLTIGGSLKAKYVIHAVGPNYAVIRGLGMSEEKGDKLLASAYKNTMLQARTKSDEIKCIAFSLISAGVFRGGKTLNEVLEIGVRNVVENVYEGLEEVQFVGYRASEIGALGEVLGVLVDKGLVERIEE